MTATAARRPARINPDTLPVVLVTTVLTAGLATASFALTFAALRDVAAWANVAPQLAWAVPVMLDAAIVVYTLAVLVHRARHESAATAWLPLAGFTAVSVIANAAHAGTIPTAWQATIGTVVAGLAPVAVLIATHTLARLLVAPATDTTTDARTDTSAASAADTADTSADADTTTDSSADTPDADDQDTPRPTASAPVADTRTHARPVTVRRHPAPSGPRRRAADHREDILTLAAQGLSVRAIADQVDVGRTAVHQLLRREAATA
jgi:hypothetical protein